MTQFDEGERIDVFFIGVGKCGTSWIYKYLTRRGDVGVPKIKEPYILNHRPEEQSDKIRDLYDSLRPRCDFSNVYYWDKSIPEKIVAHNPDAKIVLTVRKPSNRVSSHFAFIQRNGEHTETSLVDYLKHGDNHDLVERSDYQAILDRFLVHIPKERILVVSLELLASDVQEYADRISNFVGVAPRMVEDSDSEKVLGRSSARFPAASRAAKRFAETLRELGYLELLSRFKESQVIRKVLFSEESSSAPKIDYEKLPDSLRALDASFPDFLRENEVPR